MTICERTCSTVDNKLYYSVHKFINDIVNNSDYACVITAVWRPHLSQFSNTLLNPVSNFLRDDSNY